MNKQEVINKIKGMTVETFFSNSLFVSQPKEADFGWVFDCPGVEVKEVE